MKSLAAVLRLLLLAPAALAATDIYRTGWPSACQSCISTLYSACSQSSASNPEFLRCLCVSQAGLNFATCLGARACMTSTRWTFPGDAAAFLDALTQDTCNAYYKAVTGTGTRTGTATATAAGSGARATASTSRPTAATGGGVGVTASTSRPTAATASGGDAGTVGSAKSTTTVRVTATLSAGKVTSISSSKAGVAATGVPIAGMLIAGGLFAMGV
jgi:hypothetical protein